MGMMDAVKKVFSHYADFTGRARRSEYWYFALFNTIVGFAIAIVTIFLGVQEFIYVAYLYQLAVLVPSLAVMVRRLHDTNRSGWWLLIVVIPLIGPVLLLVWYATEGTPGANHYGPDPKTGSHNIEGVLDSDFLK